MRFERIDKLRGMKLIAITLLIIYSGVATVLLLRNKPQTIVVGVDESGTRLLTEDNDKLAEKEVLAFIRGFVALHYRYSSETYERQISQSGDLMTLDLWNQKQSEYEKISKDIVGQSIIQDAEIADITQVGASAFDLSIGMTIQRKLEQKRFKIKVRIELTKSARSKTNPYPFSIARLSEEIET